MKKKYYKTPALVTGESTRGFIPAAAIAAGVTAAAASATAATASTVGIPLAAGYVVGRAVKSAMEFHPNEPMLPALKKVYG